MREVRVGLVTDNHYPHLGGMEYANHFLMEALERLPETSACVACATMPMVPAGFRYPYNSYRARSFSILTRYLHERNVDRMVRRERPDVLHGSMLHGGGDQGLRAARRHGLPVVVSAHGADIQVVPQIRYGARLDATAQPILRRVVAGADKIHARSTASRRLLLEMGADEDKIAIIPNGVPHEEIGAVPFEDMRARHGIPEDDFLLITVGRNSPVKRLPLLFRALAIARRAAPGLRCLSTGPEKDLRTLARTHGVEEAIVFTGTVEAHEDGPPYPALVNLQRAADLYVSVSYVESFGNAAIESLACGTPVLCTRSQGIVDVVREGETGFVLDEETPAALAETLVELCGRRDELRARREQIRNSVAHLTWTNVARQHRDLYASMT